MALPHVSAAQDTQERVSVAEPHAVGAATQARTATRPQTIDRASSELLDEPVTRSVGGAPWRAISPVGGFIKHYEIIRNLDEGGMGVVFLARDTKLGRLVAIKFLKNPALGAQRLLEEAQATARIKHENVVTIYDIDEFDGELYMVLEYVDGRTLRQVISDNVASGRAFATSLALNVAMQVARALVAAHAMGIVHRDLKPENIMLLDTGQVKVLDFGIAKQMDTDSGGRIGTRLYMAPEQWSGGEVDPRSDIWAVGLVLYELMTGKHPLAHMAESNPAALADVDQPLPSLGASRPDLGRIVTIVDRCSNKRKEQRFSSAKELLEALASATPPIGMAAGEDARPFAGLSAFQEADAGRFFGRQRDVAALWGRLDRLRLVTIIGPSGAGKSSFVRAGLIPALRASNEVWDVLVVRPGRAPIAALVEALGLDDVDTPLSLQPGLLGTRLRARCRERGPGHRALLFVDQFEEIFTLVASHDERMAFLNCILGAADDASSPVRVILAVRSDFLDRIAEERPFMDQVVGGLFFLPAMQHESLHEALVRPVEVAGYQFESDDMIEDMLRSLDATKIPLPLLQFTAAQLWEARDESRKLLTRRSYDALGGVAGALSTHANSVFAALSPRRQRLCRAICLRLVTPQRTRAIVGIDELSELANRDPEVLDVVQYLSNARLLSVEVGHEGSGPMVELIHESLIERWPKLSQWIDESADDAEFLARLRAATTQWMASGERLGLLWRDHVAEEARAWYSKRKRTFGDLTDDVLGLHETRYLEAVVHLLERTRRRRRIAIASAFVIMSAALFSVAHFAVQSRMYASRAEQEAQVVREKNAELERQALRGRNAVRVNAARKKLDDPTLALALLREIEAQDIPKDWSELVSQALLDGVAVTERVIDPDNPAYCASVSPDGKQIAVAMNDATLRILDTEGLILRATLRGHDKFIWSVAWSPDGKRLLTASGDKTARVWLADGSGEPLVLRGHEAAVNTVFMSSDGERIVTASDDKTARLWRASDGKPLHVIRHPDAVSAARFSPDATRLVTTADDGIGRMWNSDATGDPLEFRGHQGGIVSTAFSPDGTRLVTAGFDGSVRVWDSTNGNELAVLRGHEAKVMSAAWSHDGKRIATACKDKTVRIWNADGGGSPIVLRGHQHWVYSADFSPGDRYVVTTSLDRSIRLWDLDKLIVPAVLRGHEDTISAEAMSPDGKRIATTAGDLTVRVWNSDGTGKPIVLRGHRALIEDLAWEPNGRRIATVSKDGTMRVWSLDEMTPPLVLHAEDGPVRGVDWSRDGRYIATLSNDGRIVRLWTSAGQGISVIERAPVEHWAHSDLAFDPTGKRILIFDEKHDSVDVVHVDEPTRLIAATRHEAGVTAADWSPDGSRLASASKDHTVRVWHVDGERQYVAYRAPVPLQDLRFSPDGRRLAMIGTDGVIVSQALDPPSEPIVVSLPGNRSGTLAWLADGKRIIARSNDPAARIWNALAPGQPFVLAGSNVRIASAMGTADGKRIIIRPDEPFLFIWPDVQPLTGPEDTQLWAATTYCIPPAIRMDLLSIPEPQARADEETCRSKVQRAIAARN